MVRVNLAGGHNFLPFVGAALAAIVAAKAAPTTIIMLRHL